LKKKSSSLPDAVVLDPRDNVATSLHPITNNAGVKVGGLAKELKLKSNSDLPQGHKIALSDIKSGQYVIKFGEIIGIATADISKGSHVHTHNLSTLHGRGSSALEAKSLILPSTETREQESK
jgi:altronate dehydratase small subunit